MDKDPIAQNISGVQSLVGSKINKVNSSTSSDDVGEPQDVLAIDKSDDYLLAFEDEAITKYRSYEAGIKPRQQANKVYYLGKQKEGTPASAEGSISANLLFEAEETFLPAALAKNPEPVVWTDNSGDGVRIASDVKTMLQYHADVLVLRRKLTMMVRHWSIYFIGVIKHGWDDKIKDIKSDIRDPQNFIFDPDACVDVYGDYDGYLGEKIPTTAEKLMEMFPKHRAFIIISVSGKLGTQVTYTEWWTDEYTFCTYKGIVLDKSKNPNFNYDSEENVEDEEGNVEKSTKKAVNHFARPKKPYTFLSVFTLGEQPHDITNLIEQNIPNQRRISRRTEQLDYNLSRANNSDVFSEINFNQETAKQASAALAAGRPILVPKGGPIEGAIHRLNAPAVGAEFFKELENSKQDLRSIFGVEGISSQPPNEDQTARGMILNQSHDTTRIGGGIGDALEQVADNIFNYWVQLYYVYYDEGHFGTIMGRMKAAEYVELSANDLNRKLVVSVSPDSMKPKDEVSEMNQAMALWDKGAIDPKTLFTIIDFPDPHKTAEQVVLWMVDKNAYMQLNFPELMQQMQGIQTQNPAPPGGGGPPPEQVTEPDQPLSAPAASADLSNVPINTQALPQ